MKTWIGTLLLALCVNAQAAEDESKDINNYLVDITGGAVSAIGLIEAPAAAITTIETSQDLVVVLTPFGARDGGKTSFGIAITPAKTSLLPMSGHTYLSSSWARLAGNLTLSYAQTQAEHDGVAYKKNAFALDTVYFFKLTDDPVYRAGQAFKACADKENDFADKLKALVDRLSRNEITPEAFERESKLVAADRAANVTACMDADLTAARSAPWNSGRMSVSYGEGRMRAVGGGPSYSLGRAFNLNAQYPLGSKGVAQVSLRHARDAIDLSSLGTTPRADASRLAALRMTYGDQDDSSLRALVEVSSSRSTKSGVYEQAFMYAVGLDKKLVKGSWLEFRLGRNRSVSDGKEQTTALLSLNLAPTLMEFKK
jgi:hypothetical protein